ncbi:hypothetical protein niasHT_016365 [Heterodera trifolii]|uniref:Uncharacterized protein n=1 Tax=Heterodera trifolii TaxID=157864 RepID=A0ABD2L0Y6_9BILA
MFMPSKVSVRLLVYEKANDIFWDLSKGTLHEDSVPTLTRSAEIEIGSDRTTVREIVEKVANEFCKQQQQLLDEEGDEKPYQIMAIFEDKQLNMQIQREMDAEPNTEYTAILLLKNGQKDSWLF